jgi:hypothetical protein
MAARRIPHAAVLRSASQTPILPRHGNPRGLEADTGRASSAGFVVVTDRLSLTRAFEDAGLKSGAERIATEIYEAIHDYVATKADLRELEHGLRDEIGAVRTELRDEIGAVRTELPDEIGAVRTELRQFEAKVELRFERVERHIDQMVVRPGALLVVVAGLLFAALHYWPPHG